MLETVNKERMTYTCNKIIENQKIIENNAKFWTFYLDNQLKQFVILYNFNFFEVANRFHGFISMKNKYEFNENEIRRHWSFLHAMRYLNKPVDNEYYTEIKKKFKIEEELREQKIIDEESRRTEDIREKKRKEEEDEIKRNQEIIQKLKYERFNLITIKTNILQNNLENGTNEKEPHNKIQEENGKIIKREEDRRIIDSVPHDIIESKGVSSFDDTLKGPQEKKEQIIQNDEKNHDTNIKKNLKFSDDFFESDEFINNIFKSQSKLNNDAVKTIENDIIEPNDSDLFPINTNNKPVIETSVEKNYRNLEVQAISKDCNLDSREKTETKNEIEKMEQDLENTKSFDDLIRDDINLKEQYENIKTYHNFAVKSLNYFIPKLGKGLKDESNTNDEDTNLNEDKFEEDVIKKTSYKINQLLLDSVYF